MTQHEIYVHFENSANWHQNRQMINGDCSEGNCIVFEVWLRKSVSPVQKFRTNGQNQQMLSKENYDLKERQALQMRNQKSSKRPEQPASPNSMQPSHPQTAIISYQQYQLHNQSNMTRIQQKQALPPNNFSIHCVAQAQNPQNYAYFFNQIRRKILDVSCRVNRVFFPSVDKVGIEQANRSTNYQVVFERYFLIALFSSEMFVF